MEKSISIIIPCFNEGKILIPNIEKVIDFMKKGKFKFDIWLSNDGSTDDTLDKMKELEKKYSFIKITSYEKNIGKGYAVKSAMLKADNDILIFMDTDLSTDLSAIKEAYEHILKYNTDIVIGSRRLPDSTIIVKQSLIRRFIGKACALLKEFILPLNIKDSQCGFKAFKKHIGKIIFEKQLQKRFMFDTEIIYIARIKNFSIHEIPVIWENNPDSKVSPIKDSIISLKELIEIRKMKKYYM